MNRHRICLRLHAHTLPSVRSAAMHTDQTLADWLQDAVEHRSRGTYNMVVATDVGAGPTVLEYHPFQAQYEPWFLDKLRRAAKAADESLSGYVRRAARLRLEYERAKRGGIRT